jgi:hypothetical protein
MDKIKLKHYSNGDFKGYIKPDFFGLNSYTSNSARDSSIKRSFFYIGKGREYYLNGARFLYIAEIEKSKIYDLIKDDKGFLNKYTFNETLQRVKFLGYYGVSGNNGYAVVCLFKAIKYIDKKTLTK